MVRRVKAYLKSMKVITDEEELHRMSQEVEPPSGGQPAPAIPVITTVGLGHAVTRSRCHEVTLSRCHAVTLSCAGAEAEPEPEPERGEQLQLHALALLRPRARGGQAAGRQLPRPGAQQVR